MEMTPSSMSDRKLAAKVIESALHIVKEVGDFKRVSVDILMGESRFSTHLSVHLSIWLTQVPRVPTF